MDMKSASEKFVTGRFRPKYIASMGGDRQKCYVHEQNEEKNQIKF